MTLMFMQKLVLFQPLCKYQPRWTGDMPFGVTASKTRYGAGEGTPSIRRTKYSVVYGLMHHGNVHQNAGNYQVWDE